MGGRAGGQGNTVADIVDEISEGDGELAGFLAQVKEGQVSEKIISQKE